MLIDVGNDGLISFKEEIDKEEFRTVMGLMRSQHRQGVGHYDYKCRGSISAKYFALSMVAVADASHLSKLLDRVDGLNEHPNFRDKSISLQEFKEFDELLSKLGPFPDF